MGDGPSEARHGSGEPRFEDELRQENYRVLLLTAGVFVPLYLACSAFDSYVAPEVRRDLLVIRVCVVGIALAFVLVASFERARRFSWGLAWGWWVVMDLGMLAMIPYVGAAYPWYIMGFLIAQVGGAAIPCWPPRYTYALLAVTTPPMVVLAARAAGGLGTGSVGFSVLFGGANALVVGWISRFKFRYAQEAFDARATLGGTTGELSEALANAKEVDRLKNEFFANVSHELRTPLALILGPVAEVLARLEGSPEGEALKVVERNANRLRRMIDDLLDLSKLDAKGMTLRIAQVDVDFVAEAVANEAKVAAAAKGVELKFSAEGEPTEVFGDAERIRTILSKLVGNAMRFTPEGGRIDVRVTHGDAGVFVVVEDDGPGIPLEEQERLLTRFHPTAGLEPRRAGGVGIDLALARELAVLHGGTLKVESEEGQGSKFELFLRKGLEHLHGEHLEERQGEIEVSGEGGDRDLGGAAAEEFEDAIAAMRVGTVGPSVAMAGGRRPRVLVVEDEVELRGFVVGLLSEEFDVVAVQNGAEAMQSIGEHRPDLVLTDVMMPGTSGLDLCRAMKADGRLSDIPVVFLTARGESAAALECYDAGGDDFVTKPFHSRVLVARVRAQLRMRRLAAEVADARLAATSGRVVTELEGRLAEPLRGIAGVALTLQEGDREGLASTLREGLADVRAALASVVGEEPAETRTS